MDTLILTPEEKNYLWSKIEYRKKQTAIKAQNQLHTLLQNSEKTEFSTDELKVIFNALEYNFKNKLVGKGTPIKKDVFVSLVPKFK